MVMVVLMVVVVVMVVLMVVLMVMIMVMMMLLHGPDPLLHQVELARHGPELVNLHQAPQVALDARRALAHLGVHEELAGHEQRAGHHDVGERDVVADEELAPAAVEGRLDGAQGALEPGRAVVVARLVKGHHAEDDHEQGHEHVRAQLLLGEAGPLLDLGLGLGVGAQELGGAGPARRHVARDRLALGQGEAVGALKGGHLAERELGQELGRLVGLFNHKVGRVDDLEPVEGRQGLDLGGCVSSLSLSHGGMG